MRKELHLHTAQGTRLAGWRGMTRPAPSSSSGSPCHLPNRSGTHTALALGPAFTAGARAARDHPHPAELRPPEPRVCPSGCTHFPSAPSQAGRSSHPLGLSSQCLLRVASQTPCPGPSMHTDAQTSPRTHVTASVVLTVAEIPEPSWVVPIICAPEVEPSVRHVPAPPQPPGQSSP